MRRRWSAWVPAGSGGRTSCWTRRRMWAWSSERLTSSRAASSVRVAGPCFLRDVSSNGDSDPVAKGLNRALDIAGKVGSHGGRHGVILVGPRRARTVMIIYFELRERLRGDGIVDLRGGHGDSGRSPCSGGDRPRHRRCVRAGPQPVIGVRPRGGRSAWPVACEVWCRQPRRAAAVMERVRGDESVVLAGAALAGTCDRSPRGRTVCCQGAHRAGPDRVGACLIAKSFRRQLPARPSGSWPLAPPGEVA